MCFYIRSFFWLLIFIFIAYPLAFISAIFYVFIQPFGLCCQFMNSVEDYLFELVSLPLICMYNIVYSKSFSVNKSISRQSSLKQVQSCQLNARSSFGNINSFVITGNSTSLCPAENNLVAKLNQTEKQPSTDNQQQESKSSQNNV